MQYHRFEALAFPRNEEKYLNIRRNLKVPRVIKKLNFDDVIKANHVIPHSFLYFYIFYKPVNMYGTFQGYNYSQSEMKHG